MTLSYVVGDATQPRGDGPRMIVHVCNDVGAWGRGFVLALSQRWKAPEQAFKRWAAGETEQPYKLGEVQFVPVEPGLWVANLIGQHDIARKGQPGPPPIRYDALRRGLSKVRTEARRLQATVHMPRIGAGVAGGDWGVIEPIVREELSEAGIEVAVYDLPAGEQP